MNPQLPVPVANADSARYWEGARERKLLIRKCLACDGMHFLPRLLCPECWSDRLEWIEAEGSGVVHSVSVVRRASDPAFASRVPYVLALIELKEGPRMLANILGDGALCTVIGDAVTLTFEERGGEGALLPQFMLATSAEAAR